MKKLLLFMFGIVCSISMFSIPITINGSTNVTSGQVYSYNAIGGMPASNGTKAKWTVTNGYFNTGDGTKPTTLNQDADFTSVDIVWTTAGMGTLAYYYKNGSSAAYEGTITVTIVGSSGGGGNGSENPGGGNGNNSGLWPSDTREKNIKGPKKVYPNKEYTFEYTDKIEKEFNTGNVYYNRVNWFVNNQEFQTIKLDYTYIGYWQDGEAKDIGVRNKIVLKPQNIVPIGKDSINVAIAGIAIKSTHIGNGEYVLTEHSSGYYYLTILAIPELSIAAHQNIACDGENISFSITGFPNSSSKAEVTWEAVSNSSLVSGQGTKSATYRASGNGFAKIKATVKYNGLTYNLENNYVWVGAPPKPTGILGIPSTGIQTNSIYNLTVKDFAHSGIEKFYWNPLANDGKAGYSRLVTNNYMATLYTGSNNNQLAIMLSVRAENKCGNSAFYILPVTVSGSGISPFMLKSNSSLDEDLYDIKVYNFSTGQIVYQENKTVNFNIESTTLKQGIYIIESTDENGNITRTKVMKK